MGQACTTRERNDAGASGPWIGSRHAQATGTGGGTVPVATPSPTRGGGSRGAAVACGRRATARRPACNGRDAARVGGGGSNVFASNARRGSAHVDRSEQLRDGWAVDGTEKHHAASRAAASMSANVPFDDIHVTRDDFTLPVSLREVIARRNRLRRSRHEVAASRTYLRVDRIQATRCGFRSSSPQRETIRHHPLSLSARF